MSLADKLDTVVGLTNAGEKSTGSRDPFGLRRQMHGIVRILMDLPELVGVDREIGLRDLVAATARGFGQADPATADAVVGFAYDRVRYVLEQRGQPSEVVNWATSAAGDVVPLRARRVAAALQRMRGAEDFQALAVLFKRVKNIARELKGHPTLDRDALTEPAERTLLAELDARRPLARRQSG